VTSLPSAPSSPAPTAPTTGSQPPREEAARKTHGPRIGVRVGYRRIITLLIALIIVPTGLMLSLGIVVLVQGRAFYTLLLGILMLSLVAIMITGTVLVWAFVRREAKLSELQADFVSKVSHELRTPLTAIRLFAEAVERTPGDAALGTRCANAIIGETDRLASHIGRLLDWGRMQSGKKIYSLVDVDLRDVLTDAIAAYSPIRLDPHLHFTAPSMPESVPVHADRAALVDAVVNLISNAHKYGGTEPRVELDLAVGTRFATIAVTDHGEGIPRHEQHRIFEKFYRIDDRLSRMKEGSGLGLAIVDHVVKAHGGEITVDSAPTRGSTFRIVLPLAARSSLLPKPRGTEGP
jgi:two-component system phosphate regulon sensor histidine kinase PhoR